MRLPTISLILTCLLASPALAQNPPGHRILYIQPLGDCQQPQLGSASVQRALSVFYDLEIRVLPCQALPKTAYYKPRHRYRAERILEYLNQRMPADGWRILGLTATYISTTNGKVTDWGILGLGELPGKASVISSFRCKKKARNTQHAIVRLAKVAVHEIGHTLGLPHCPTHSCLMEDAFGKVSTVDGERDFCARCRQAAAKAGCFIKTPVGLPW
ncbi:MAG TPA: matrixin family metalloprotease [Polyangia bacterium]